MTPGEQFPDLTPANLGAALDHPVTFSPKPEPFWPDLIAIIAIALIAVGFGFAVKGM